MMGIDPAKGSSPTTLTWRHGVLAAVVLGSFAGMLVLDPIPQDTNYHAFADTRTFLGIPNFLDVVSNLPFLIVGALGLRLCRRTLSGSQPNAWAVLFLGIGLVSLGSAYYHWAPSNPSLVWDRLPMTVGFMGLFVALLGEYIDRRMASTLLLPAILLGLFSVIYWGWFDDLRLYFWVQLIPLLTIPAVLAMFRSDYTHGWMLLVALLWYLTAKVAESHDGEIFASSLGIVSGHTLKHLLAAAGCFSLFQMLRIRKPR